jgi:type III secretion protein U
MPKGEKISPMAGFKRIFAMKHLIEVLKSILKISVLTIMLIIALKANFLALIEGIYCGIPCIGGLADILLGDIFKYSAGAFIVIAGFDFMYQKHTHIKSLMMSKDEIKREYKESEGDPHIKGKRRQLAHELAMGDPGVVKKSSAVVVNPTHFAVAILYDKETTPLPVTLAKGVDVAAAFIRGEAESAGVPIFYSPRLARQLYADAEINRPIPSEFFEALAEILVWIDHNRSDLYGNKPLNRGIIDLEVEHDAMKRTKDGTSPSNGTSRPN